MLRIKSINETQRDMIIANINKASVGVNVHYIPMPMLSLFKNLGYDIKDYPRTYELYSNEISLPVYNELTIDNMKLVCDSIVISYNKILSK